jgi:nitrogen fixation protein FixH
MIKPKTLWPLGIVLASLFYVSGVGVCSYLAIAHKSELVNEKYYDQEIKYQSRIDSLGRAQRLATRATAIYDEAARRIVVSLPAEHAGKTVSGEIELYRPSAAGQDRQFKLEPDEKGVQIVDASALPQGLWKVRVNWTVDNQEFFLDQKLAVGPASLQAKLAAANQRAAAKN